MTQITKARTLTYDGEEVYARTHIDVVDGLDKSLLLTPDQKNKINSFSQESLTVATPEKAGLMSEEDKKRLDRLKTNSNEYSARINNVPLNSTLIKQDINLWPSNQQTVNLNKSISSCNNGIILVWRLDETDDLYHYQYLPKLHVQLHRNVKVTEVIPINLSGQICTKVVIVNDQQIRGTDDNFKNNANKIRLHEILEY